MGRAKKNIVHNYFDYDEVQQTSTCKVEDCGHVMKGCHATNMMYHLNSRHRDVYKKLASIRRPTNSKKSEISNRSLMICCSNLVKKYDLPVAFFDDVNFKTLISLGDGGVTISSKTVLKFINENAYDNERSSSYAENGHDDSSDEILKIKGEKGQCSCSRNDGDDNLVHNADCPLSKDQAYWNFFEVSIDTASCLLCQQQLSWDNIAELKAHMTDHHPGVTFRDDDKEFENGHRSEDVAEIYLEDNPDEPPTPRKRRKSEKILRKLTEKVRRPVGIRGTGGNDGEVTPQIVRTLDSFGQYVADLLKLLPRAKSMKFQLQIVERLLKEAEAG